MSLGILSDGSIPLPLLLDTVRHSETGHLTLDQARNARSRAGALGPYQFLERYLPEFGYGMPTDIPVADVQDPSKARELAGQYITGYSDHHSFTTPLQKLVAYNRGPKFAAAWVARGENIDELPEETKQYITRAAAFLNQNQQSNKQEPKMADTTLFGLPFDPKQAAILQAMGQEGNPLANATAEQIASEQLNRAMVAQGATPPQSQLGMAANASAPNPALMMMEEGAQGATQYGGSTPILANTDQGPVRIRMDVPGIAMPQPTYQRPANRRDSSAMSLTKPRNNINDLLIAMGSAGMTASAQGGLEALGAMGTAYGDYQNNQQDAINKYNAAIAKMAGKNKGAGGSAMSGVVVNDALNRIDPLLSGWSTGVGSYLNMIPGTDAQKVKNLLATVKGNIGFDKLQAMRDASPTGGALGQVSERELSFLQSVFGSLEQDQSSEELRYNLELLRYVYNSVIHGEGNHPYQMPMRGQPGGSGLSADDQAILDKYKT